MTLKLINAKPSPFSRKVAIALQEKGIPFETNLALLMFGFDRSGRSIEGRHWRERRPALARYVDRLEARPSFLATRPQMMGSGMQDAL